MIRYRLIPLLLTLLLAGCQYNPVRIRYVDNPRLNADPDLPRLAAVGPYHEIASDEEGIRWEVFYQQTGPDPARLPLERHWGNLCCSGRINDGRSYPILFDTGAPYPLVVNDRHVLDNALPVYPRPAKEGGRLESGVTQIEKLSSEDLSWANVMGLYVARHVDETVFGIPYRKLNTIIIGLPLMIDCKYLAFDQVNQRLSIAGRTSYPYDALGEHERYPLTIERTDHGVSRLTVEIPLENRPFRLMVDTGLSGTLLLSAANLDRLPPQKIVADRTLPDGLRFPYFEFDEESGRQCRALSLSDLRIGTRRVDGFTALVVDNDHKLLSGLDGLIGLNAFRDREMVLDFENMRMLVHVPPRENSRE